MLHFGENKVVEKFLGQMCSDEFFLKHALPASNYYKQLFHQSSFYLNNVHFIIQFIRFWGHLKS